MCSACRPARIHARVGDSGHQTATACSCYARADGDVRAATRWGNAATAPASFAPSIPASLGGYWTHIGPGGWYTDTAIMGSHLKVNPKSTAGIASFTTRLHRVGREAGLPIALKPNLSLEPQAQIIYQNTRIDSVRGFRVRRVLRAEERSSVAPARGCRREYYAKRHLKPYAGGPGAHAGRTRQVDFSGGTTSTSAMAAPRRAWDWASRSRPASGSASTRRRDMASTWAASGAKRCRATWECGSTGECAGAASPGCICYGLGTMVRDIPDRGGRLHWLGRSGGGGISAVVACDIDRRTFVATPANGSPAITRDGHTLNILRREHGRWRCWRAMRPAGAAPIRVGLGGLGFVPGSDLSIFPAANRRANTTHSLRRSFPWLPEPSPLHRVLRAPAERVCNPWTRRGRAMAAALWLSVPGA